MKIKFGDCYNCGKELILNCETCGQPSPRKSFRQGFLKGTHYDGNTSMILIALCERCERELSEDDKKNILENLKEGNECLQIKSVSDYINMKEHRINQGNKDYVAPWEKAKLD